jgi:uncharacterized protein
VNPNIHSSHPAPDGTEDFARALRGFGPIGLVAILVVLFIGNYPYIPASALAVLIWVRLSRTPWRELGFVWPVDWLRTIMIGTIAGILFKFAMKAVIMPMLGADPVNQAYHYLAGNSALLPGAIYSMIVSAGFAEETVFRGFLFERFSKLFGAAPWAKALIVLVTAIWFGLAHYSTQGIAGVQQATIVGLILGATMALTGRIWLLMVAHAVFDLTALWMIYYGLESRIAHLIFK